MSEFSEMSESSETTEPASANARPLTADAATVSLDAISPPEQGDALYGLTLAIAGVGPASAPHPFGLDWDATVGPSDAWSVSFESDTKWYVLLSQDCDIVRDGEAEPTVSVAPLMRVKRSKWTELQRNGYSSRRWPYPLDKFNLADDEAIVIDLAWTTSVLKGSLTSGTVKAVRALTGPKKAQLSEWLSQRMGRIPFPDDVVQKVLEPSYAARLKLSKDFEKASSAGGASEPARAVAAVERWYVHRDGNLVFFLGQVTGPLLVKAGFYHDGSLDEGLLTKAASRLTTEILKRMAARDPNSGYQINVVLADLHEISAADFQKFALLMR